MILTDLPSYAVEAARSLMSQFAAFGDYCYVLYNTGPTKTELKGKRWSTIGIRSRLDRLD
jgi:hypothetical protein